MVMVVQTTTIVPDDLRHLDLEEHLKRIGPVDDGRLDCFFGNAAQGGRQDHHGKACLDPDQTRSSGRKLFQTRDRQPRLRRRRRESRRKHVISSVTAATQHQIQRIPNRHSEQYQQRTLHRRPVGAAFCKSGCTKFPCRHRLNTGRKGQQDHRRAGHCKNRKDPAPPSNCNQTAFITPIWALIDRTCVVDQFENNRRTDEGNRHRHEDQ